MLPQVVDGAELLVSGAGTRELLAFIAVALVVILVRLERRGSRLEDRVAELERTITRLDAILETRLASESGTKYVPRVRA